MPNDHGILHLNKQTISYWWRHQFRWRHQNCENDVVLTINIPKVLQKNDTLQHQPLRKKNCQILMTPIFKKRVITWQVVIFPEKKYILLKETWQNFIHITSVLQKLLAIFSREEHVLLTPLHPHPPCFDDTHFKKRVQMYFVTHRCFYQIPLANAPRK